MGIGVSVFLIALGAILAYAVQDAIPGVELNTVGVILMIAGVAGLLISLFYTLLWTRRDPAAGYDRVPPGPVAADRERIVERERL